MTEVSAGGERESPRRPVGWLRRLVVGAVLAAGLVASYVYVFVTLIEAPRGNPLQGWPMYVFCAAAVVVAAAGVLADNRRLSERVPLRRPGPSGASSATSSRAEP